MKKKFLSLTLIATTILSLTACGNKVEPEVSQPINSEILETEVSDVIEVVDEMVSTDSASQEQIEAGKSMIENSTTVFESLPDGIIVEKEYILGDFADEGDLQYNSFDMFSSNNIEYLYVITNNSGKDVAYDLNIECVDKDGFKIEDENSYGDTLPNGKSTVLWGEIALDADEVPNVDHLVVNIKESTNEDICMSDEISFVDEIVPDEEFKSYTNLKVTTTNNSEFAADTIYVLFIKYDENGDIIEISHQGWSNIAETEPVPELQAGATGVVETRYSEGDDIYFNDYEIYIDAYREMK